MLPEAKRRKLKKDLGLAGGGGRRRGRATAAQQVKDDVDVDLCSEDDSDKQLLAEVGATRRRSTATSLLPGGDLDGEGGGGAARGGRRPPAPALDTKTQDLLDKCTALQERFKQAQAEDLSEEDSEELGGLNCGLVCVEVVGGWVLGAAGGVLGWSRL